MTKDFDVVVVGAGPNGLAAAITAAQAQQRVCLIEGDAQVGGGCRSAALTLPNFIHDVCSAIHPLAVSSTFFRNMPLAQHGVEWVYSPAAVAHPFDDGTALTLEQDLGEASQQMGRDARAYRALVAPLAEHWQALSEDLLGPLRIPPRHPLTFAHFAPIAPMPAATLAKLFFRDEHTRGLFAGLAAHSMLPLEAPVSSAYGLVLAASAHAVGWPMPRGGAQHIPDALAAILQELGGEIVTNQWVQSLDDLPKARATLLDVTPRQLVQMAGTRLPNGYRRRLMRFRHGPGVFKVDYALREPIPWKAKHCARAATMHLGGTLPEIAASERAVWHGQHVERPFVLLAQHTLFDASRAPNGQHTAWAYCHVPPGSERDMTAAIEAQIERFAPGFRDCVLARHTFNTHQMQAYNPNYIGGDILGGAQDLIQTLMRPVLSRHPYQTALPGIYLCSASTPPGGGVHGMSGYHAAQKVLHDLSRGVG